MQERNFRNYIKPCARWSNLRCSCGEIMKKSYVRPELSTFESEKQADRNFEASANQPLDRSRTFRAEEHESLSHMPQEGKVPNMRIFRGFAIVFTVALISLGIFILYDSMAQRSAAASDSVVPGAVLFSLALTLLYFISRPTVK